MAPIVFEESGFRVTAPDPSFRFSELPAYRALSGQHLKEMDIGWWEKSPKGTNRLLLLELKGMEVWQSLPDDPKKPHEHLIRTCVEKATDTLLMLSGAWLPTTWGKELAAEAPPQLTPYAGDGHAALKLVFLIDIPASHRELLLAVRDQINGQLSGRLRVFGLKHVSVFDFETAQKKGLPVTRV